MKNISKYDRVCVDHFSEKNFQEYLPATSSSRGGSGKKMFTHSAVPDCRIAEGGETILKHVLETKCGDWKKHFLLRMVAFKRTPGPKSVENKALKRVAAPILNNIEVAPKKRALDTPQTIKTIIKQEPDLVLNSDKNLNDETKKVDMESPPTIKTIIIKKIKKTKHLKIADLDPSQKKITQIPSEPKILNLESSLHTKSSKITIKKEPNLNNPPNKIGLGPSQSQISSKETSNLILNAEKKTNNEPTKADLISSRKKNNPNQSLSSGAEKNLEIDPKKLDLDPSQNKNSSVEKPIPNRGRGRPLKNTFNEPTKADLGTSQEQNKLKQRLRSGAKKFLESLPKKLDLDSPQNKTPSIERQNFHRGGRPLKKTNNEPKKLLLEPRLAMKKIKENEPNLDNPPNQHELDPTQTINTIIKIEPDLILSDEKNFEIKPTKLDLAPSKIIKPSTEKLKNIGSNNEPPKKLVLEPPLAIKTIIKKEPNLDKESTLETPKKKIISKENPNMILSTENSVKIKTEKIVMQPPQTPQTIKIKVEPDCVVSSDKNSTKEPKKLLLESLQKKRYLMEKQSSNGCAVPNCRSVIDDLTTLHEIPTYPISLRERWLERCAIKQVSVTNDLFICSNHFLPSDFKNGGKY